MELELGSRIICFALKKLVDAKQPLDYELLRACASEAMGAQYEDADFQLALANLVDLRILVQADRRFPLQLAQNGYSLAESHGATLVSEQRQHVVKFVLHAAQLAPAERIQLCHEVVASLPAEPFVAVRRAVPAETAKYAVNAAAVEISPTGEELYTATYILDGRDRLSFPTKLEKVRNRFIKDLDLKLPDWAVAWNEDEETFGVVSSRPLPVDMPYYQATIRANERGTVTQVPDARRAHVESTLLLGLLEDAMAGNGWRKLRFDADFVNPLDQSTQVVDGLRWTQNPLMRVELVSLDSKASEPESARYGIVADPGQRQVVTVSDWVISGQPIDALIAAIRSSQDHPALQILPDADQCELTNPSQLRSVRSPRDELEVRLTFGNRLLSIPAEMLALRKELLDTIFEAPPARPESALAPTVRLTQARSWLATFPKHTRLLGFEIRLINSAASLAEVTLDSKGDLTWRLHPPQLRFNEARQRNTISTDPRALFKYGPSSPPRAVTLAAIVAPESLQEEELEALVQNLTDAYRNSNLGQLVGASCKIVRYPGRNIDGARNGLQALSLPKGEHEVILAIGYPSDDVYGRAKDLCATVGRRPAQFCFLQTAKKIARGSFPTAKGLALQTYLKTLRSGDALWTLAEQPSSRTTVFVGVGYSKRPKTGDEATSHASLLMSDGVLLDWKAMGFSLRPRRYFDASHARAFIGFLDIEAANRPNVERFVVIRRGDVYPAEIDAIRSELERLAPKWTLDFVALTDSRIRIFQDSGKITNPESGLLHIVSEDRCLLSVSALPNEDVPGGSVRLMELKRAIGTTPIQDIGREIYDQAFLCWGSPSQPPRSPMPLDLAEKVAGLTTMANREEALKYFPL